MAEQPSNIDSFKGREKITISTTPQVVVYLNQVKRSLVEQDERFSRYSIADVALHLTLTGLECKGFGLKLKKGLRKSRITSP